MTTRYRCPISVCAWFHEYQVASGSAPVCPPDILAWTAANWADMSDRGNRPLAVAHVVDAHLSTHSPVEWMTELRQYQARAETAESQLDRLLGALEQTAEVAAGVHPVTSMRLPSRAEVEDTRALLNGAVNGGGADA